MATFVGNAKPITPTRVGSSVTKPKLDQKASSENEFSPREDTSDEELQVVRTALAAAKKNYCHEDDEWITLKLDNKIFNTQRSTLLRCKESLFNVMFQKNSPFLTAQDLSHPSKPYLIDRSPKYFAFILQYLRTGDLPEQLHDMASASSADLALLKGLHTEAKYYNMVDLVDELDEIMAQYELNCHKAELTRQDIIKALINVPIAYNNYYNSNNGHGKASSSLSSSASSSTGSQSSINSIGSLSSSGNSYNNCNLPHSRLRLQGVILVGLDLSNLDLSFVNFCKADLTSVNFSGANLEGADFSRATIEKANFAGANLHRAVLSRSKGAGVNLDSCNLQDADLSLSDFSAATLRFANLTNANMSGCMMHNSDLTGANLKKCSLKGAILSGAEFNESCRATLPMGGVLH